MRQHINCCWMLVCILFSSVLVGAMQPERQALLLVGNTLKTTVEQAQQSILKEIPQLAVPAAQFVDAFNDAFPLGVSVARVGILNDMLYSALIGINEWLYQKLSGLNLTDVLLKHARAEMKVDLGTAEAIEAVIGMNSTLLGIFKAYEATLQPKMPPVQPAPAPAQKVPVVQEQPVERLSPDEQQAVDEIVKKHMPQKSEAFDGMAGNDYGPTEQVKQNVRGSVAGALVTQRPSLVQVRTLADPTNYCAYYAIFNALRLAENKSVMDRKAFADIFGNLLEKAINLSKQEMVSPAGEHFGVTYDLLDDQIETEQRTYSNLGADFLRFVLQQLEKEFVSLKNVLFVLPFELEQYKKAKIDELPPLLQAFVLGKSNELILITMPAAGVENVQKHYITVKAERKDGKIILYVYDSMFGDWSMLAKAKELTLLATVLQRKK